MKRLFRILLTFLMVISVVAATAVSSSAACNHNGRWLEDVVKQYYGDCGNSGNCGNNGNCRNIMAFSSGCQDPQDICSLLKGCGVSDSRCNSVSELLNRLGCGAGCLPDLNCGNGQPAQPEPADPADPAEPQQPTDAPEAEPTEASVPKPTQAPTEAPASKPTQAPTQKPTAAPIQKPTQAASEKPTVSNDSILAYEREVARLVNAERAKYGLSALSLSETLCNGARVKSQDMRDSGYFDHNSPRYGTPFEMMKSFGVSYRTAGENIAMGYATPQAVVTGWMNSPGHRANILNASFKEIGVGYVASGNYWTQWFIG